MSTLANCPPISFETDHGIRGTLVRSNISSKGLFRVWNSTTRSFAISLPMGAFPVSRPDKATCQEKSHLAKSVHVRRRHQAQSHHRPARAARCPISRNIYRQPEVSWFRIIATSRMFAYRSSPPMNAIASSITQSFSCCHCKAFSCMCERNQMISATYM